MWNIALNSNKQIICGYDGICRAIEATILIRNILVERYRETRSGFNLGWEPASDLELSKFEPKLPTQNACILQQSLSSVILAIEQRQKYEDLLDINLHPSEMYSQLSKYEKMIKKYGNCLE